MPKMTDMDTGQSGVGESGRRLGEAMKSNQVQVGQSVCIFVMEDWISAIIMDFDQDSCKHTWSYGMNGLCTTYTLNFGLVIIC